MATIYEVSALAGVSLSSVSRVMNNHDHVSEKTKMKVMAAMAQLEYRPNSIARSLASNRSNSVGVLVSELHGPYYGDMLSGIESELRAAGKHAIITAGHSDEASEKAGIEFLIDRNCDALILHVDAVSDEYLMNLGKGSTPFVIINRYIADISENCIYLDNHLGGYQAAKYLLEQGHRNIAYISGPLWKQDAQGRLTGHKQALMEANIEFDDTLLFEGDFKTTGGTAGMTHFLKHQRKFSALVCANDEMASGAMKVARDNKLIVPDDCSIIGFDNVFFTEYLLPQLSTIDNPIDDMGRMAARWVFKHVYHNKNIKIKNLFTPKLVIRESILTPHQENQ